MAILKLWICEGCNKIISLHDNKVVVSGYKHIKHHEIKRCNEYEMINCKYWYDDMWLHIPSHTIHVEYDERMPVLSELITDHMFSDTRFGFDTSSEFSDETDKKCTIVDICRYIDMYYFKRLEDDLNEIIQQRY